MHRGRKETFDGWVYDAWELHLTRPGGDGQPRTLTIDMQMGTILDGQAPTLGEALALRLGIARDILTTEDYQDWASVWATDPADQPGRDVYTEQVRVTQELRDFLAGEDLDAWLYDTDGSAYE